MLSVTTLELKRFTDIVSGSGLFSIAALRLDADVTSFEYALHEWGAPPR